MPGHGVRGDDDDPAAGQQHRAAEHGDHLERPDAGIRLRAGPTSDVDHGGAHYDRDLGGALLHWGRGLRSRRRRRSTSPRWRSARSTRWRALGLAERVQARASGRVAVDLLRGAADGERSPRPAPRLGPGVQGPLPPLPDHAAATRCPARAAGTATACRSRSRSRRSSGLQSQARHRGVRRRPSSTQRCRESVSRYVDDWIALTERAGGLDRHRLTPYWTLSNDYIESVWWLLRQMWDDGLLYEGHRVTPYCARCGTALSSHELGQPGAYRDVVDASVYVRFPVRGPRRGPAGVDDDAVDPDLQRRRRRRCRTSATCALAGARRGA